jgi:hypothetical protein
MLLKSNTKNGRLKRPILLYYVCWVVNFNSNFLGEYMSKTFTFAGTCVENDAVVYKFANDASRAKALERFGCTEVKLVELPNAMDKEAAVAYLATVGMTAIKPARTAKSKSAAAKPAKAVPAKLPKVKTTGNDEVTREVYAEAMSERSANGMPVVSFAQYKRDAAKAVAFFAKCDAKLAAKRAAGKSL